MSPSQYKRMNPWCKNFGRDTVLRMMWDDGAKTAPLWYRVWYRGGFKHHLNRPDPFAAYEGEKRDD